jgi:hypothetical protein
VTPAARCSRSPGSTPSTTNRPNDQRGDRSGASAEPFAAPPDGLLLTGAGHRGLSRRRDARAARGRRQDRRRSGRRRVSVMFAAIDGGARL